MLTLGACSALHWLWLLHLALLMVSTTAVVSSATPVQVVAFLALHYSTSIFLFPSYLNLETITWPGLVMTTPHHFVAESLSFWADFLICIHIENERQGCWNVLALKQSMHIFVFRPDSVQDDAYSLGLWILAFSAQLLTPKFRSFTRRFNWHDILPFDYAS